MYLGYGVKCKGFSPTVACLWHHTELHRQNSLPICQVSLCACYTMLVTWEIVNLSTHKGIGSLGKVVTKPHCCSSQASTSKQPDLPPQQKQIPLVGSCATILSISFFQSTQIGWKFGSEAYQEYVSMQKPSTVRQIWSTKFHKLLHWQKPDHNHKREKCHPRDFSQAINIHGTWGQPVMISKQT